MPTQKLPIKAQGVVYKTKSDGNRSILCLKRSVKDGGFWHILTGTLEPAESLIDCLRREIKEEIGINNDKIISISDEINRFLWSKNDVPIWVFTYAVEIGDSEIILNEEHTEFKWLDLAEARKLLTTDSAKEILTIFDSTNSDPKKESIRIFDEQIHSVIKLLELNNETEARVVFNRDIYDKYNRIMSEDGSALKKFAVFFFNLDEYLNNKGLKISGFISREDIIGSYYSDYQDDLKG